MRLFLRRITASFALLVGISGASGAMSACGLDEEACTTENGSYHIVLPEDAGESVPAILFVHGFGSSGEGVLRNSGLVNAVLGRGYALIAPNGLVRPGREQRSWSFHPQLAQQRDEVAFLTAVRDDAARRYGIDGNRTILAGFSIGGSMTSYLACAQPDAFPAYAPVGGGFWRPHPEGCAGPVNLLHTHGWTDGTVPLEGRVLRGSSLDDPGALAQGDIFHTMLLWREVNGCQNLKADEFAMSERFWQRWWTNCTEGKALQLALFPSGHRMPNGWTDMTVDWFESLQATE